MTPTPLATVSSTNAGDKGGRSESDVADADCVGFARNSHALPISMLLFARGEIGPALTPKAMLLLPVVLLWSALTPMAVLLPPVVVDKRAHHSVGRVVAAGCVVVRAH